MHAQKDYEELLKLFGRYKVRYCVVGAFAAALYSRPRFTKDLDIFVDPSPENAKNILAALKDFGFGALKLKVGDFTKPGIVIQLGYEPVRIDLLTAIDGVTFNEVWKDKTRRSFGNCKVYFMGKRTLIRNKRASGRDRDLLDLKELKA
ncbi:conserved hypothetical protein [sediment metagenome]|uniref:Protein containing DUF1814 n=1 Tax=sediment metagenome TaxID=749907 RepID=D9PFU6_9ZZZZ